MSKSSSDCGSPTSIRVQRLCKIFAVDPTIDRDDVVPNSRKLGWASTSLAAPPSRSAIGSLRDSKSGRSAERSSCVARSISSTTSHIPSRTACVRTPARHRNLPGTSAQTYVPRSDLTSQHSSRCSSIIRSLCPTFDATCRRRAVLPHPGGP